MTVAELIKKLKKLDPRAPVAVEYGCQTCFQPVVELRKGLVVLRDSDEKVKETD